MSGIVRGWTDASELYDLATGTNAFVSADEKHVILDHSFPVAVVPLDDATLSGMADRFLDVFESESKLHAMRAALGLGGEPSTDATEPRG